MKSGQSTDKADRSTGTDAKKHRRTIPVIRCSWAEHQPFYRRVQLAFTGAQRVTVLTGAGISTSAGIPDFRSAGGLYNGGFPGLTQGTLGSDMFDSRALRDPQKLFAYGRAMGALRNACQYARPTACHEYIAKLHEHGRLLRCYTQNIDGLQTRGHPHLANVVLELHGNIQRLTCNRCGQSPDGDVRDTDTDLVKNGYVHCKKCQQRVNGGKAGPIGRWKLRQLEPGLLLPQVLHNEGSWEIRLDGMTLSELEQADGSASLLLVIGTSIRTDGAAKLVKSLAKRVHENGGMVVYIDREPLQDWKWGQIFDIQLQTEIDMWALDASRLLNEVQSQINMKEEVTEVIQALLCRDDDRHASRGNPPLNPDTGFQHGFYSQVPCASTTTAPSAPKASDMVILVCHSGAAPSLARAMAIELIGFGTKGGLRISLADQCHGYVVVLSGSIDDLRQIPVRENCQLVVVHISDYAFRSRGAWRPIEARQTIQELLKQSVCSMSALSEQSNGRLLLMLCAEDELLDGHDIGRLQEIFQKQSAFDTMITSLNMAHLRTRSWAKFIWDIISSQCQPNMNPVDRISTQWLNNKELVENSDLVIFPRSARTTMLLASSFPDRPLGKPLPNISTTCPCKPTGPHSNKKEWRVDHNAVDGGAAKDVHLTAQCSACSQTWSLETAHLIGTVRCVNGRFCVLIGYDGTLGWI
ncbi:hypothetical protein FRC11_005330 [Ceratobasidium sp. 423]|nr:hypothetical protein FRC11_005330 [Ceratobasidium sp. 423]